RLGDAVGVRLRRAVSDDRVAAVAGDSRALRVLYARSLERCRGDGGRFDYWHQGRKVDPKQPAGAEVGDETTRAIGRYRCPGQETRRLQRGDHLVGDEVDHRDRPLARVGDDRTVAGDVERRRGRGIQAGSGRGQRIADADVVDAETGERRDAFDRVARQRSAEDAFTRVAAQRQGDRVDAARDPVAEPVEDGDP